MPLSPMLTWASTSFPGPPLVIPSIMETSPPSLMSMLTEPLRVVMSMSSTKSMEPLSPTSIDEAITYGEPMNMTVDPGMRTRIVPEPSRYTLSLTDSMEPLLKTRRPSPVKTRLFPPSS